jgi:hypothetical protein
MKVIYDNEPSVLEAVGNGSHRYHYDIKAVETESAEKSSGTESKTQYECQEVIVWEPIKSNKITEAVIADKWDGNQEQKLINEYNAIQLGITTDKTEIANKTTAYKEFLEERVRLKAIVDADCKTLGIE